MGSYDNNLYALHAAKGTLLWKFATDGGLCGTPVPHGDLVIFGSEDHTVYALDGDAVADLVRIGARLVLTLCDNNLIPRLISGDEGVLQHDSESKATES